MKKLFKATAAILVVAACSTATLAEDAANVYVTVSDENGNLAVGNESICVTDKDGDGALTINDALLCAHEEFCADGVNGYGSEMTDYGLSMTKLWGCENGGSYGYYVNNASAWSLADPVSDGDFVNAFVYTDTAAWSDTYCFFDSRFESGVVGDAVTLTLSAAGYDADYNPITVPVENATLVINGEKTDYTTDENGTVSFIIENSGVLTVSATSDSQNLVPPVCTVEAESASVYAPQTGDNALFLMLGSLALLTGLAVTRKKLNER